MKKTILISILFICSGCSVTIVYAPKTVEADEGSFIWGASIMGSELKDNEMQQKTDAKGNKASLN